MPKPQPGWGRKRVKSFWPKQETQWHREPGTQSVSYNAFKRKDPAGRHMTGAANCQEGLLCPSGSHTNDDDGVWKGTAHSPGVASSHRHRRRNGKNPAGNGGGELGRIFFPLEATESRFLRLLLWKADSGLDVELQLGRESQSCPLLNPLPSLCI